MRLIARYAKELENDFEIITVYEDEIKKSVFQKKNLGLKLWQNGIRQLYGLSEKCMMILVSSQKMLLTNAH